jgi:hypothetical protein
MNRYYRRAVEIPAALLDDIERVYHLHGDQAEQSLRQTALYQRMVEGRFDGVSAQRLFELYQDEVEYGRIIKKTEDADEDPCVD